MVTVWPHTCGIPGRENFAVVLSSPPVVSSHSQALDLHSRAAPEAVSSPVLELPENVTNCLPEGSISPTAYKGTTQSRLNREAV